ncbi:hypothetical protein TSMEX_009353 [Taenia solium]|eukprot:TsM_000650800 transcript=TsM_000650800 gene=TsM_000650800
MAAEGRIVCNPPVTTWDAQRDHSPFRLSAHERAICTPAKATLPPTYQEVSGVKQHQNRFKGVRKSHQSCKDASKQANKPITTMLETKCNPNLIAPPQCQPVRVRKCQKQLASLFVRLGVTQIE